MKAVVLYRACEPVCLKVEDVPVPKARPGWILVRVRAFGLNHSESILRRFEADAPYIHLPRIMGIECAGEIEDPSDSHFRKGDRVVALMGGMGRSFDGSYAEYALLPESIVFKVDIEMGWTELATVPETYFTAYSALFDRLCLEPSDSILVRGATSAAGFAAIRLAKSIGCQVFASTRRAEKRAALEESGADHPVIDDGSLRESMRSIAPGGVSKVLELVGPATLLESMSLLRQGGIACDVGVLGKQYTLDSFDPIKDIPAGTYLTSFYSNEPTQEAMDRIFLHLRQYRIDLRPSAVFMLEDIAKAHELLDSGNANGKIVVRVD
jgi:NADPH:quinone reductase and related Zn-dependent oxidoreductases